MSLPSNDVAGMVGVSVKTVAEWRRKGKLKGVKQPIGESIRLNHT
ncbi:TPA: DNA-binding protein [Candidatus Bathyarchaeota archaeon]|nr:DNA-binding protein [Candidatus Bathyarchaeota archaeon]